MGAADGTLAIMVGGSDEAFAAARPALDAMGSQVVHAGPIGAGHEVQAGPQPDALRRVHRRHRGPAARRGGRPRPGRARQGGPTHRRDHRRTRARSCTATRRRRSTRTTSGTASSSTCVALGEKDLTLRHRPGRRARRRRTPGQLAWPTGHGSAPRLDLRRGTDDHGQVRRPSGEASPRAGEDGAGLRLRHDRRQPATSSATPPTTCSPRSGTAPGSPTATVGCC